MAQHPAIAIQKMITYFDGDTRRINHALKVYGFAKCIAENEGLPAPSLEIVELSAVLHDIGIKVSEAKYNSSAGPYQEKEGPAVAGELLADLKLPQPVWERIAYLIGHHHTYSAIDGQDFQILVEADFLVNIEEDRLTKPQIESIYHKYFKTPTGRALLSSMFSFSA
ncbi:HD domain-containing protein [Propionispora vibrioides]|uniref:HD domain-containing protein n=1 Tax=Propionispora vibrioides TaxID=112903 RepID=A0A1H8V5V6_9FIRM|nr:HD domain-containing protein [Propionispora vibrioides]SEP10786.1 HD domain-containing protein [Propionispora vibrioides]